MNKLTAAQIRARIAEGYDIDREDGDEWDEVLFRLSNCDGEEPAMIALTHAQEEYDEDETFDPEEFNELFQRKFRGTHETAAAFAEHVATGETEMGDPEEAKGRAWFLENYGRYIDWQQFADSPAITGTYELIMLDPENSREVHAFEMEA